MYHNNINNKQSWYVIVIIVCKIILITTIPVAKGGSRGSDEPSFENQQALLNSMF